MMTALLVDSRKTSIKAIGNRRTEAKRPDRNNGRVRSVRIVDFSIFLEIMNRIEVLLKNPKMMMGRRKRR